MQTNVFRSYSSESDILEKFSRLCSTRRTVESRSRRVDSTFLMWRRRAFLDSFKSVVLTDVSWGLWVGGWIRGLDVG